MEKTQADALAAVVCRAIDYFAARQAVEKDRQDPMAHQRVRDAEADLAGALQAMPDEA